MFVLLFINIIPNLSVMKDKQITSRYLNPDWKLASRHGQASKIGLSADNKLQFCECCLHSIIKNQVHLSQDTKQLQFLGFGLPLYFAFVRYCIFLLLITIFCYSIPSLYYALTHNHDFCRTNIDKAANSTHIVDIVTPTNKQQIKHRSSLKKMKITEEKTLNEKPISQQQAAHEIECTGWMIYLSRIQKQVTPEQELIRFSSFFLHFIMLVYIRDRLTKMKYYFDERSATPSDFAVFIKNMPPQKRQKQQIVKVLKKEYGQNVDPLDIQIIPYLKTYYEIEIQKAMLLKQLKQFSSKQRNQTNRQQIIKIQNNLYQCEKKIQLQVIEDKKKYEIDQLQAQRAVIIFRTQDQKWELINNWQQKPIRQRGWQKVLLSQASQPDEIIWQNASYSSADKKFFKFLGWFLSILTLVLITGIFIVLTHFKSDLVQKKIIQYQKSTKRDANLISQAFVIVLGMIFLVVLFNKFVLAFLFHKFTEIQKHSSTYKFQFYFCLKYCLGLFFTTALMTLIIQDFIFNNFFRHNFGVIEQQTIMFLFNSIFVPLFWLINPMYLARMFKRWRLFGSANLTQSEANIIMENPEYDVGKRYGQVIQIMWFTFLYITIIPIGAIFSILGMFAYYWVDKYNLLRRSTVKAHVSGDLINLTLAMLEFTLPFRVAGEILFDYQLRGQFAMISFIYLGISIAYIMLPAEMLVNLLDTEKFLNQKLSYSEAEKFFSNNYRTVSFLFNQLEQDHKNILRWKKERKVNRSIAAQKQNIRENQTTLNIKK